MRRLALCAVVLLSAAAPTHAREASTRGLIGGAADWAVPYFDRLGAEPGPTVLVVGGVHGDEPCGEYAAHQIRRWPIARGRLVVIPQANKHARAAFERRTPGVDADLHDLNRNFPRAGKVETARGVRARALWDFVRVLRPQWVVDLHEGVGYRKQSKKTVGSSVIHHPTAASETAARAMVAAVNTTIDNAKREFVSLRGIVDGALARAAGEHLGAHALVVESTSSKQARSLRVRQHRIAVYALLRRLDMLPAAVDFDTVREPARREGVAVALYDARGTGGRGVPLLWSQLRRVDGFDPMRIGPAEIQSGALRQHDVVIFSGGTGTGQATALSATGRERVREFVRSGGGYVGICAGAYLALDGFSWGLGILDGKTVSPKWRRGAASLQVRLTSEGKKLFGPGDDGVLAIRYHNGPVFKPANDSLRPFRTLAVFEEEVAQDDAPKGVMVGTPAIAAGMFGKGRVCVFSPHPEQTQGLERLVLDAVRWSGETASVPAKLTQAEQQALRVEAARLAREPGQVPAKRALLARLTRLGTKQAWGHVRQLARHEADHVAAIEKLRIDNWKQTMALLRKPPPHQRADAKRLIALFDGSQGTSLRQEREMLELCLRALRDAPGPVRERFLSIARRSRNGLLRAAAEQLAVRVALRDRRAPVFSEDRDIRVGLAQLRALGDRADLETFLRDALRDPSWAVRVCAAEAAAAHDVPAVIPDLIACFHDARQREAQALGKALRTLSGENFESTGIVWARWWRDREAREAAAPEGPRPEVSEPARLTFYGLPIESDRVCFLIDISGSMKRPARKPPPTTGSKARSPAKTKLDVAKAELRRAIRTLPKQTTFNVIAFNTAVMPWQDGPVPATEANKQAVAEWIGSWEASSNTSLFAAFRAAFRIAGMDPLEGRDPSVDTLVVLSDGQPTWYARGKASYQDVAQLAAWVDWYNADRIVRIHAVSITTGKASAFLKQLAADHGGHFAER